MSTSPDHQDIPEDAHELDADRWRLYEDWHQTGKLRHSPDSTSLPSDHPGRWREGLPWFGRHGMSTMPVIFLVMSVVAMLATLSLFLVKRDQAPPTRAPLAVSDLAPGKVGGLLPNGQILINNATLAIRELRPAILVFAPAGSCADCDLLLTDLTKQADIANVRLVVATTSGSADWALAARGLNLTSGEVLPAYLGDIGALGDANNPTATPVVVVVGTDGLILQKDFPDQNLLDIGTSVRQL